jgi:hypothetical protein
VSLLTRQPDSTGGCQTPLVNRLEVTPSRYHHTMVHIAITRDEHRARRDSSSETSVSPHHNQSTNPHSHPTVPLSRAYHLKNKSWGSSAIIVSDNRPENRAIGFRSPAKAANFSSSPFVHTRSETHPASYAMGTGGPFLGDKARPGRNADHSPLVSWSRMSRSYKSSPSKRVHGVYRDSFTSFYNNIYIL